MTLLKWTLTSCFPAFTFLFCIWSNAVHASAIQVKFLYSVETTEHFEPKVSPDFNFLAINSVDDSKFKLLELKSGNPVVTLDWMYTNAWFSADSKTIFTQTGVVGGDDDLKSWDVLTGKKLWWTSVYGGVGYVSAGSNFVSVNSSSLRGSIIYNPRSDQPVWKSNLNLRFWLNSPFAYAISSEGQLNLLDASRKTESSFSNVNQMVLSSDLKTLVVLRKDSESISAYDLESKAQLWTTPLAGSIWLTPALNLSSDSKYLSVWTMNKNTQTQQIEMFDLVRGSPIYTLSSQGDPKFRSSSLLLSDNKNSDAVQHFIYLTNIKDTHSTVKIPVEGRLWDAQFSPDGRTIALITYQDSFSLGRLVIIESATGSTIFERAKVGSTIHFSQNSKYLVITERGSSQVFELD